MRYVILSIFMSFSLCYSGDVRGTTGTIGFDVNLDGVQEAVLNAQGFGIGVSPSSNLHVQGNAIIENNLYIGSSNGSSNLNISGTVGFNFQTISSDTTLDSSSIILADTSGGNVTVTLPYAGNVSGRIYEIKKISLENSFFIVSSDNLIDDTTSIELPSSASNLNYLKLISSGEQWYILDSDKYNAETYTDNLVGWWKLDESSGTTASDSSGKGHDGSLTGTLDFSGNSIQGQIDGGLNFSEDGDVSIPNDDDFDIENGSFSLWFNIPSYASGEYFLTKDASGRLNDLSVAISEGGAFWDVAPAGAIAFRIQEGANDHVVFDTSVSTTDQWIHMAGTWGEEGMKLYVNGVLVDTNAYAGPIDNNQAIDIGSIRGGSLLDGKLDDVRLYDRSLSAVEIRGLYKQGF